MNKSQKILGIIFLFIASLGLNSCGKELAINVDSLYIAEWEANDGEADYNIFIDIWGFATYEKVKGSVTTSSEGRAKIKDDVLHIGLVKFDIDQAPAYNAQSELTMILDGVTYYAL